MTTNLIVSRELQDHLIAQGIGQSWDAAPSLTVPTVFDNPPDGAVEPRRGARDGALLETSTISLFEILDGPALELGAWLQETFIEVVVRSDDDETSKLIHRRIRDEIEPIAAHGGRAQWLMGALLVERSYQSKPEQSLPRQEDRFVDRVCTYAFNCRRKILAGLPIGTP
jgi:hypothetical protein